MFEDGSQQGVWDAVEFAGGEAFVAQAYVVSAGGGVGVQAAAVASAGVPAGNVGDDLGALLVPEEGVAAVVGDEGLEV